MVPELLRFEGKRKEGEELVRQHHVQGGFIRRSATQAYNAAYEGATYLEPVDGAPQIVP
jgi:hypothetical protein